MTVLTKQAFVDKKPEKDGGMEVILDAELPVKTVSGNDECDDVSVVISERRRRSRNATFCMLFAVLFLLAAGVFGGIKLYRHFLHGKYHGRCGVRPGFMNYQQGQPYPEEEVELDLRYGEYEKIDTPKFDENSAARIVHDFSLNLTGIVDEYNGRCYVMKLDRRHVSPPQNFFDLIQKMMDGAYEVDTTLIEEEYRVVRPRILDYTSIGLYIAAECYDFDTYMLEKINGQSLRYRRSEVEDNSYCYFSGTSVCVSVTENP